MLTCMDFKHLPMKLVQLAYFITLSLPLFLILSIGIECAFLIKSFAKIFR